MYGREGERFTLAAAGDAILTRRLSTCDIDRLDALRDRIRDADASVVNLEVLFPDGEGYPAASSGGIHLRAPPWVADELAWLGFDAVAAATNHTGDFGRGGMLATMRELDEREFPYAGLGETLADARAPVYIDTPAGRVALVAACATITSGTEAGRQRPDMRGRPGLSPLHVDTTYVVPENTHEDVRDLATNLGLEAFKEQRERLGFPVPGEDQEEFTFWNVDGAHLTYESGDEFDVRQTADEDDVAAITEQVSAAERQADWVVASLHYHQGAGGRLNDHSVPAFAESFARDCVDAGADAFVGHGPHRLRGIEVYDGAPVLYSLGNFAMGNETVERLPAEVYDGYGLAPDSVPADLFDERVTDDDGERAGFLADAAYWESVLPVCLYEDGRLDRIELHPLDLGYEAPRPRRGRPVLADEGTTEDILAHLAELSEPYDTDLVVEDGRGIVRP